MARVDLKTRDQITKVINELIGQQSVTEFAESIGVSRDTVNNWLFGKSDIRIPALIRISEVYGVSIDYILGRSNCKSLDLSLQGASEVTGLSVAAIENLRKSKSDYHWLASDVISSPSFLNLMQTYMELIDLSALISGLTDNILNAISIEDRIDEDSTEESTEDNTEGSTEDNTEDNNMGVNPFDRLPELIRLLKYGQFELSECCIDILNDINPVYDIIRNAEKLYSAYEKALEEGDKLNGEES